MQLDEAIRTRRTHKAFGPEPVPPATLDELFELARWVPNHHVTNPWRFRVLGERTRARLIELAESVQPGSAVKLQRAPTLVAVSARLSGDPEQDREDLLRDRARGLRRAARRARARARRLLAHRGAARRRRADARCSGWPRARSSRSACSTSARPCRSSASPSAPLLSQFVSYLE